LRFGPICFDPLDWPASFPLVPAAFGHAVVALLVDTVGSDRGAPAFGDEAALILTDGRKRAEQ